MGKVEEAPNDGKPVFLASSNKIQPLEIENVENGLTDKIKKDEKRDNFSGKLDFFMSALSYAVGLGAVWRFPYKCYKNGGGAFLLPFAICMIFIGIPMMYLESAVGQFKSRGPLKSWVMVPFFKGVGASMNLINHFVNIYYITIIAYSLYFLALSLNTELPWAKCDPSWSSPNCVDDFNKNFYKYNPCNESIYLKCEYDGQCYEKLTIDNLLASCDSKNKSNLIRVGYHDPIYPSQDYWRKVILDQLPDLSEPGYLVWQLVLVLLASWIVCFFCLFRGIKQSGKIVYVTAILPYVVLIILGIQGWILEGADEGIRYFSEPDWSKLKDPFVWRDAAVQVFFTQSVSYGGLVALSSYNKYNHNILRDSLILSLANFLTCILAGLVIFAYIGNLSNKIGLPIDQVAQDGAGLVYVVLPFAVTNLPAPPVWSILLFLMLINLGMGTMMASVETLITSFEDLFPILKKTAKNKAIFLAIICTQYFLSGLLLCTQTGQYWIDILDDYAGNWALFIIGMAECVSVGWFYGVTNFKRDIQTMGSFSKNSDKYFFIWWRISWIFVIPSALMLLTILEWINSKPLTFKGDKPFPEWTQVVGYLISVSSLLGIFGWMLYICIYYIKNKMPLKMLFQSDAEWEPLLEENKEQFYKAREMQPNVSLRKEILQIIKK